MKSSRPMPRGAQRPTSHGPRRRTTRPWVVLTVALLPASLSAQLCDQDKLDKASGGGNGYAPVSETLCEGIYGADVSQVVVSLVGLTDRYYLDGYAPLRIRWSGPGRSVHVRVTSWSRQAYQMDASSTDGALRWDPAIPNDESIGMDEIGILGWVAGEAEGPRLHIPLRVEQGEPGDVDRYVVRVLPNARLTRVAVTVAKVDAVGDLPRGPALRDGPLPQPEYAMGRAFRFTVRHDELDGPGVYYMLIRATQDGETDAAELPVWFYHPGTW